jgi:hypothetical protein
LKVTLFKPEIGALIGAFYESDTRVTDGVISNLKRYN